MAGYLCPKICRRELLRNLLFCGGAMGASYIAHRMYVKKYFKDMEKVVSEGESIAERFIYVRRGR